MFSRASHSPSVPSWATSTANPSASSPVRSDRASRTSSSTTSTRIRRLSRDSAESFLKDDALRHNP